MLKPDRDYSNIINRFEQINVLIIGDVMVDSYLWGSVDRISPEAPVPIVLVNKKESRLGGAANVALNVQSLCAKPYLCSVIGNDLKGKEFIELLEKQKISSEGLYLSDERITTTKFRILGDNTQLLRVDEEIVTDLNSEDAAILYNIIENFLQTKNLNGSGKGIGVIIFEDYDKGIISEDLIKKVVSRANQLNIPVVADPKKRNFTSYYGVTLFKPNLKELKEGLKEDFEPGDMNGLGRAVDKLQQKLNIDIVITTLSEVGVYISYRTPDRSTKTALIPAHIRSISDVSGAGDTVIGTAALCLASKLNPMETAYISNLAGGLVCEEVGVVPINKEKLQKEIISLK